MKLIIVLRVDFVYICACCIDHLSVRHFSDGQVYIPVLCAISVIIENYVSVDSLCSRLKSYWLLLLLWLTSVDATSDSPTNTQLCLYAVVNSVSSL